MACQRDYVPGMLLQFLLFYLAPVETGFDGVLVTFVCSAFLLFAMCKFITQQACRDAEFCMRTCHHETVRRSLRGAMDIRDAQGSTRAFLLMMSKAVVKSMKTELSGIVYSAHCSHVHYGLWKILL